MVIGSDNDLRLLPGCALVRRQASHYLNQYWHTANRTFRNKYSWNWKNIMIFLGKMHFKMVYKTAAILFGPPCESFVCPFPRQPSPHDLPFQLVEEATCHAYTLLFQIIHQIPQKNRTGQRKLVPRFFLLRYPDHNFSPFLGVMIFASFNMPQPIMTINYIPGTNFRKNISTFSQNYRFILLGL